MQRLKRACCIICLLLLPSCGYHWGRGDLTERYSTLSIPYVEGDNKGAFTAALIHAFSSESPLVYRACGADLLLQVQLLPPADVNIGFRYAPSDQEDDYTSNIVVANEGRITMGAVVALIDRQTGTPLWGPTSLKASLDYDFEPDLGNVNYHAFALGQLEMHNLAQDAAIPALYTLLAKKIVDYVNHSW